MRVYIILKHNKDGTIKGIAAVFINSNSANGYVNDNTTENNILSTQIMDIS